MAEARAIAKFIRISPTKARQVVDLVRGMDAIEAAEVLKFSTKRAAGIVGKVISSAIANAEKNHNLRSADLVVAEASVNEGPTLKRIRPRAQGRAARINKRTSHIAIILREKAAKGA